ncbi:prephenate dehydrogenase dimerization domain-containing protein [Pseudomonas vanderleydeniana]|uniref:Prephenate dehydrogenase/arogenate dehydrogenase family protein n=1 Tax=Pseudomonas vanderleydeniana TaxID=2745495 RepID=A0A9E6PHZ4_9PSED|nr:prephenate dehydrogenase dimerization domain-containing protein [Pseudomonas vanderleydeniana]QXI26838.1 prephenate dehydrogenase/arogenate dehydrogenase family protein [Pseudomonas vanderleydeniana]
MNNFLILGGSGIVGGFIAGILQTRGHAAVIVDLVPSPLADHRVMDALSLPDKAPYLLEAASAVVFALPEDIAIQVLERYAASSSSIKVIINTCSVQGPFQRNAQALFPEVPCVGINPMFSPTLDCRGRPVVLCERASSKEGDWLEALLHEQAMLVRRLSPEEHDKVMAVCQTLPHAAILAFTMALSRSQCDLETIQALAPPPMRTLLSLSARILLNAPVTYWDIQKHNSAGQLQRDRLADSLGRLDHLCRLDTPERFAEEMATARRQLGRYVEDYGETCELLFTVLNPLGRHD